MEVFLIIFINPGLTGSLPRGDLVRLGQALAVFLRDCLEMKESTSFCEQKEAKKL
jgi:hypothetical protein